MIISNLIVTRTVFVTSCCLVADTAIIVFVSWESSQSRIGLLRQKTTISDLSERFGVLQHLYSYT